MFKSLNGTLGEQLNEYTEQQEHNKQAAVAVKNYKYTHTNLHRYTNPPYNIEDNTTQQYEESTELKKQTKLKQKTKFLEIKEFSINNKQFNEGQVRKKWGKFLVLYDNGSFSFTLGPDYWCFLPTFFCFAVVSIAIIIIVLNNTTSLVSRVLCFLVCGGQLLSYFLVATSNPGIAREIIQDEDFSLKQLQKIQQQQPQKLCKKCGFCVPKSSYHCRDCDMCILGYDHHCPWISKCIGENNLKRFYFFLIMTPLFLIYISVAFIIIVGNQTQVFQVQRIRNLLMNNFDF